MFPAGVLIPSSALALAARQRGDGVRDGYGRAMLALIVLGGLCALGSAVALLVAWCAAVLNARLLPDRRWYSALLWGGIAGILTTPLLGLGVLLFGSVMTAYLVAGPDGVAAQPSATIPTKRVITRWSGGGWALAGIGLFVACWCPSWPVGAFRCTASSGHRWPPRQRDTRWPSRARSSWVPHGGPRSSTPTCLKTRLGSGGCVGPESPPP